ncbi:heavy metal-binding domain-containing protein [Algibacter sp. TI.3.09]|uniref:heavy metal-binding domain-containing protein n=1 Tax=Algibacter sp. TI.3.09 TaxID=3121298 RepID=UPI00311E20C0
MILTTTNTIEGHSIKNYLGVVSGVDVNMPKTTISFNMEKYYENYENKINEVKEAAFQKLHANANKLGANAVVGIALDIETMPTSGIIIVSITGTAVMVV